MAKKKKTLPANFKELLEAKDLEAVFDRLIGKLDEISTNENK